MAKEFELCKRQGKGRAIILIEETKNKEYEVCRQNRVNEPFFEGSTFMGGNKIQQKPAEGHFFVYHLYTNNNYSTSEKIVGVAHSKGELSDKIYGCAVEYCKKTAKKIKGRFVDLTSRAMG